jgi:hypothetical protein
MSFGMAARCVRLQSHLTTMLNGSFEGLKIAHLSPEGIPACYHHIRDVYMPVRCISGNTKENRNVEAVTADYIPELRVGARSSAITPSIACPSEPHHFGEGDTHRSLSNGLATISKGSEVFQSGSERQLPEGPSEENASTRPSSVDGVDISRKPDVQKQVVKEMVAPRKKAKRLCYYWTQNKCDQVSGTTLLYSV